MSALAKPIHFTSEYFGRELSAHLLERLYDAWGPAGLRVFSEITGVKMSRVMMWRRGEAVMPHVFRVLTIPKNLEAAGGKRLE